MNKGLIIGISGFVAAIVIVTVAVYIFSKPKEPPKVPPQIVEEQVSAQQKIAQPPPPPLNVVVASQDVPANVVLTLEMLELKPVPLPQPAGTETNLNSFAGSVTKIDLKKGEYVKKENLFTGEKLSFLVPRYKRAILFNITQQSSLFYMVGPTDHVDILGVFPGTAFTGDHAFVKTILQNITILASDRNMKPSSGLPPPPPPQDQQGKQQPQQVAPVAFSTLTVALTPRECELLILAEKNSELRLTLRSEGSEEIEASSGSDRSTLLTNEFIERWAGISSTLGHPHEVEVIKEGATENKTVTRE